MKTLNLFCALGVFAAVFTDQAQDTNKEVKAAVAAPNFTDPAKLTEQAPETFKAQFDTTKGKFTIEVTRSLAPNGADRFYNLVKSGYFTDIAFFRVIPGFMCQFGIHGDPAVSAKWRAASITDDPVKGSNTRGTITFATAGPGTRTTQLFINFGDNVGLDGQGFSPFGKVTEGMDVVDKINSEYGEGAPGGRGPDQGLVQQAGNAYLKKEFPNLDYIKFATIISVDNSKLPPVPVEIQKDQSATPIPDYPQYVPLDQITNMLKGQTMMAVKVELETETDFFPSATKLQSDIEKQLQENGIKIISAKEGDPAPTLVLHVLAIGYSNGGLFSHGVVYYMSLSYHQHALLQTPENIKGMTANVTAWSKEIIVMGEAEKINTKVNDEASDWTYAFIQACHQADQIK